MDVVRDKLRLRAMVIQFPHYFESQLDGQDKSHSIGKMEISDFLPIAFPKCPYFFFIFIIATMYINTMSIGYDQFYFPLDVNPASTFIWA